MATIREYFQVAQRENATDIYFGVGSPPFLKINGALKPLRGQGNLNKAKITGLAREVFSSEKWSEFESRGELIGARTIRGLGRLRVTLADERKGPCMACRLIPLNPLPFEDLGLPPHLMRMVLSDNGLVLLMGRSGSGKTTTLASFVEHINSTSEKSILTIGAPMEYELPHQRSFFERIQPLENGKPMDKKAYGSLLQTADVMVIDGFPLEETISPALNAAAKGLQVFATLETNGGVAEVLARIINSCPPEKREYRRTVLARVLRGAIWQHLLPLKDGSGFAPVVEILVNDPVTSDLINGDGCLRMLRPTMAARGYNGMQTMHQALEAMKRESLVHEDILSAFESEILRYYVSPIKGDF